MSIPRCVGLEAKFAGVGNSLSNKTEKKQTSMEGQNLFNCA